MLAVLCLPIAAAFWFTGPILGAVGFTGAENQLAAQFARWSIIGIVPEQGSYILKQYLQARQDVMPALVTSMVCAGLNVGANQLFIHGVAGWGGLGFKGSPLATACTNTLMGLSLALYTVRLLLVLRAPRTPVARMCHHHPHHAVASARAVRVATRPASPGRRRAHSCT